MGEGLLLSDGGDFLVDLLEERVDIALGIVKRHEILELGPERGGVLAGVIGNQALGDNLVRVEIPFDCLDESVCVLGGDLRVAAHQLRCVEPDFG